ncbi:MAG TPA: hypothetical protein VF250_07315 [Conexibacter sp.]
MKRFGEALVMTETVCTVVAIAVAGLLGGARAQAASPLVRLRGEAHLTQQRGSGVAPAVFHVHARFATDPPAADPFTIRRAVVYFPDHAGTNGQLFPSCSARRIERFKGNIRRCPKGSQIGSGTVTARANQLGITATGHVTAFNSRRGRAITLNVQTFLPAYINESFEAPLEQLHGRYGEKLTIADPPQLQQILDGVWVAVQDFDLTVTGVVRRHGVAYSYLKARTCPRLPLHGVFDFVDGPTGQTARATADAKVRCTAR